MPYLSFAEYAKHRGISRPRVSQLAKAGRLVLTDSGRVNVEESDALLAGSLDTSKRRRPPAQKMTVPDGMTESAARTRGLMIKSQRDELRLRKERGELLDRSEVERAAFDAGRQTRDSVLQVSEQHGDELHQAAKTMTAFEFKAQLKRHLEAALRFAATGEEQDP